MNGCMDKLMNIYINKYRLYTKALQYWTLSNEVLYYYYRQGQTWLPGCLAVSRWAGCSAGQMGCHVKLLKEGMERGRGLGVHS